MFWSWLLLNEKLSKYDLYAILFLTPGTAIILFSSNVSEGTIKSNALHDFLLSNQSLLFLSLTMGMFMIGGVISMQILRTHEKMTREIENKLSNDSDEDTEVRSTSNITFSEILSYRWNLIPMLYLPWFAGLFCCLSSTLVKSLFITFNERTRIDRNTLQRFGELDILGLLLNVFLLSFMSFYLLNKALQHFEPLYILPFEKVSLLINNLLCGGIILREFRQVTHHQVIGFIVGTLLCIVGVFIFLWKKDQNDQMKDFMQEEIEEYKLNELNARTLKV